MKTNIKPHILFEVFGYPSVDLSEKAEEARRKHFCPFKASAGYSEKCTKDKANDPLGVCTLEWEGNPITVCPYRFLEIPDLLETIAHELLGTTNFQLLPEIPLKDADNRVVGNLDSVLVVSSAGEVVDFVGVEFQSVYISQNLRTYFEAYKENPEKFLYERPILRTQRGTKVVPRPDFLSSVKRLNYQLLYKGAIFSTWRKKIAVVLQRPLWDTILDRGSSVLTPVDPQSSECHLAWYIVDYDKHSKLAIKDKVCISFGEFKNKLFSNVEPQSIESYMDYLSERLRRALSKGGD